MNRWESAVVIVAILVVGFLTVVFFAPSAEASFASYTTDIVLAIFGVAGVVIIVKVFGRRGSG